jgi:DNA-binding NtrC family response regulator
MEMTLQKSCMVLVVDDEPEMCWVLKTLLEQHGYSVRQAANGREAISLATTDNFQVMLLDAKLPDMDGLALARKMVRSSPGVILVIISGYYCKNDEQIEVAIKSGVINEFIGKPFKNQKIVDIIKANCKPKPSEYGADAINMAGIP